LVFAGFWDVDAAMVSAWFDAQPVINAAATSRVVNPVDLRMVFIMVL
jgi:hypothetical protein